MKHLRKTFCLFLIFFEFCFVGISVASSASWDRIYNFKMTYSCYDTSVVQSTLDLFASPFDGVYRISTLNDNLYVANVDYTQRPPVGSCLIAIDLSGWYNLETSFCGCGGESQSGCCCLSAFMHQNVSWNDLNYTLGIESISSVAKRFYLQSSDLTIKYITGFVAAYIQKEDGSWMFLKNLPYLFSPGEEGIDFKCNSYKFEYVLDETPCGPQTYTLIKNKEKLFNARLDQPTFYQPVNFVPHVGRVVSNYSVNGLPSGFIQACVYDGLTDAGLGCLSSDSLQFTTDQLLVLSSPYYSYYWDSNWNIYGPVSVTLNLLSSAPAPITWLEYYLHDDWNDYLGGWGPGSPYLDKMLLDTYLGPSINGFVGYGTDYDEWFEPLTVNALDEIVCSPTVTQSYYYNKASCVYTEVVPVLEFDGTHSFYPGEMCAGSPAVEVWYQTCSGAVKYLYMEGAYKTDCRQKGSFVNLKGGQRSLGGSRQRLMEHGLRGAYERQNIQ